MLLMEKNPFLNLAKRYYEFTYKTAPTFATYLGIHKYDHLLGDFSKASMEEDARKFREFAREAGEGGLRASLKTVGEKIDFELLKSDIDANLRLLTKSKDWQKNPNLYVETPLMGIFLLVSRDSLPASKKVRAIISRLNLYSKMLSDGRANVKKAPKIYSQIALETLTGAKFFVSQLRRQLEAQHTLTKKEGELLEASVKSAREALGEHEKYLVKLFQETDAGFALGKKLFEEKLRKENFLDLNPGELLELGKKEFARIEAELTKTARKLNAKKSWHELVEEYKNLVPEKNKLVSIYKDEAKRLVKFLKKNDLLTFPKKEICIVQQTPLFERPTVPYAAYMPPPVFESRQVGFFWVTPVNELASDESQKQQLREHSLPSFMITTLHESYPGHHLQFCVANQVKSFVRKHGQSSLLCEGWALYCEQMMGEAGYYTDPRTKIFMLKDELWRAARVIIDVSLHCFGMGADEAVSLLVDKVKLAHSQAEAEVRRYTMSPTQPMSYLVGKLLILRMREKAKKIWGKNYSLKRFHDGLLSCGTIPQPLIEKELFR